MWITLSKAAEILTRATGRQYFVDDLMPLVEAGFHSQDDARGKLTGFAIAPRGAWDSVKPITIVKSDSGMAEEILGETRHLLGDRVFRLDYVHAHQLALEGSSEVSRFLVGLNEWNAEGNQQPKVVEAAYWANNRFIITLDDVRVRKGEVELLALRISQSKVGPQGTKPGPKVKVHELQEKARTAAEKFFASTIDAWNADQWPAWKILNQLSVIREIWGDESKALRSTDAKDQKAFKEARKVNLRSMCDAVNSVRPLKPV